MNRVSTLSGEACARIAVPGPAAAFRQRHLAQLITGAFGIAAIGAAIANPTGPKVVSGQASFSQTGTSLVVRNTPGAIINWQSFSIGSGQMTNFIQASSNSTVLNRVIGIDPSIIMGTLESNGHVFLINPNGMVFGKGSMIDTAGLVVSTLDLSDADFKSGNMHFSASPTAGDINAAGVIQSQSGDVYVIAPNITNTGAIQSRAGDVIVAAGQTVDIVGRGLNDIHFEVAGKSGNAINLGTLSGDAVGVFANTINQGGSANSVAVHGGQIVLSAVGDVTLGADSVTRADGVSHGGSVSVESQQGDISVASGAAVSATGASGGFVRLLADAGSDSISGSIAATGSLSLAGSQGGTIEVLGQQVNVLGGARLDASGQGAGGSVFVGGGAHGSDATMPDAQFTFLAGTADISAAAARAGNGGHVVLYGVQGLDVEGGVDVRGGTAGGNGGFVETSGRGSLIVTQAPLLAAHALGKGGTWLIDPTDVTISSAVDSNESGGPTFTPTTATANINTTTLETAVNAGGSVIVSTTSAGAGTGNITVANALDFNPTAAATLTLNAVGSIAFNASLANDSATHPVNLALNASLTTGSITFANGITVQTGGGNIVANSNSFTSDAAINTSTHSGGAFVYNTGSIDITTHGGDLTLTNNGNLEAAHQIVLTAAPPGGLVLGGFMIVNPNLNVPGPNSIQLQADKMTVAVNQFPEIETGGGSDFIEVTTFTPTRPIVLTGLSYNPCCGYAGPGAQAQYGGSALVISNDLLERMSSGQIVIGTASTPSITLETPTAYANQFNSALSSNNSNTEFKLTATHITEDANTNITASALNLNANVVSMNGTNGCENCPLVLSGTATGNSPSFSFGATGGLDVQISSGAYAGGLSGYNTVTLLNGNYEVATFLNAPGNLNLTVQGTPSLPSSLSVGDVNNSTAASITAGGTANITVDGTLSVIGGANDNAPSQIKSGGGSTYTIGGAVTIIGGTGIQSFAVIDPPNLTLTAPSLSLTGGSGPGSYAAVTSGGNVTITIAGPIALTAGSGNLADAVIVAPTGFLTSTSTGCPTCTILATNPFTSTVTEAGIFQGGVVVVPPVVPPTNPVTGVSVAGLLGNYNTNEQDTTLNGVAEDGSPVDLGIAIWVVDQLCGSDS